MVVYVDTSALSKRYFAETGSAWLTALIDPGTSNDVYTVILTAVEITAAITRRERGLSLTSHGAAQARTAFAVDLETDYQTVTVDDALINVAILLAERHGLRGYDAVQLAAGTATNRLYVTSGLPPILFISADNELNAAARLEGLTVENPNEHP